jgi:predicted metal-dependent phosphoesterase TrpH
VSRCDLHVHSIHSTDSGNYALRRARLGESYTSPERVYRSCRARGMTLVTISDHNTVEGALRIAHEPDTFLSVEVTTRFPEDDVPLHVLVWNLTEEDHRDLQPHRASVYELVRFLRERRLAHALAHPLYRMGPPLAVSHVERMMLLFGVWEGRNGARPQEANELACRLAATVSPASLAALADRHGIEPPHDRTIALTGGSDDHGALDIATTWTDAPGDTPAAFLAAVTTGGGEAGGAHGSTTKLAHAVAALFVNAYRNGGGELPDTIRAQVEPLFDDDAEDAEQRHREIAEFSSRLARLLGERARSGGVDFAALPGAGRRLSALAFAAGLQLPYLATANHHAGSREGLGAIEHGFFGSSGPKPTPRALVFTDTFFEVNGVAGTMRRLAAAAAEGSFAGAVVVSSHEAAQPGTVTLPPDWSLPLPSYEAIDLRFPLPTDVLERIEAERPDVIQVATPGPVGVCGLAALYASADAFCFPSTTDTFGQVLLEAGASGLPVVAAATGGALELVHNGRTGALVPPDEPRLFAAALLELADDPALRRRRGAAGRAAALERTWPTSITALARIYREVLGLDKEESLAAA